MDIGPLLYRRGLFELYDELAERDAQLVMQALHETFPAAHSLLDVGAGTGQFVARGRELGLIVSGYERSRLARRTAEERHGVDLNRFDLHLPPAPAHVDVAYSFEVAEHIPRRHASRFVRFLTSCAPCVFLTAASPGQGGHGHVNEQPASYWVQLFAEVDYRRAEDLERAFTSRLTFSDLTGHWKVTNKLAFIKGQP